MEGQNFDSRPLKTNTIWVETWYYLRRMSRRCELFFSSLTLSEATSIEVDLSAYMQNMQLLLQRRCQKTPISHSFNPHCVPPSRELMINEFSHLHLWRHVWQQKDVALEEKPNNVNDTVYYGLATFAWSHQRWNLSMPSVPAAV